jgi:hypothetical protein
MEDLYEYIKMLEQEKNSYKRIEIYNKAYELFKSPIDRVNLALCMAKVEMNIYPGKLDQRKYKKLVLYIDHANQSPGRSQTEDVEPNVADFLALEIRY